MTRAGTASEILTIYGHNDTGLIVNIISNPRPGKAIHVYEAFILLRYDKEVYTEGASVTLPDKQIGSFPQSLWTYYEGLKGGSSRAPVL